MSDKLLIMCPYVKDTFYIIQPSKRDTLSSLEQPPLIGLRLCAFAREARDFRPALDQRVVGERFGGSLLPLADDVEPKKGARHSLRGQLERCLAPFPPFPLFMSTVLSQSPLDWRQNPRDYSGQTQSSLLSRRHLVLVRRY